MTTIEFFHEHYIIAFFALVFITALLALCFELCIKIINRFFRVINICVRGWPPTHLDADGDMHVSVYKYQQQEQQDESRPTE